MDLKFVKKVHIVKEIFTILFTFALFTKIIAGSVNSKTGVLMSCSAKKIKYKDKMK
jgi:hypothetical protein